MKLSIAAGLFIMICMSSQVSAEIYKWTNADGELVYSQTPPPQGITATVVDSLAEKEADIERPESETSNEKIIDANSSIDVENAEKCEVARNNIESLGEATSDTLFKSVGEESRTYTQEELNVNIEISREFINTWCDQ